MKFFTGFILLSLLVNAQGIMADTQHSAEHDANNTHADTSSLKPGSASKLIKYVCPMHPQIVRDHPSTCPICGMDLVEQIFEQTAQTPKVAVGQHQGQAMKQGLAIKTSQVQKTTLWKYIPTFGKVVVDESKVAHVHPRASGWIKDLQVNAAGEQVEQGQLLYHFYSPEILSAQQDYILAYTNRYAGTNSIRNAAYTRLKLLGMDEQSIAKIRKTKMPLEYIPVYAPQAGTVLKLSVQNGMYVQPGTEVVSLANLNAVWVEVEVLPLQQDWLKQGLIVNLTSDAYPDRRWENRIEYIYPSVDSNTQATIARVPLVNDDGALKPDMYLDAEIYGGPKRNTLAIPMSAVIDDGEQKRVVKQLEDGRFEVVKVVTGMQTRGVVEIYSGLSEGDQIVVSGQFLIDSESQIQSNLMRLMQQGGEQDNSAFTPMNDSHAGH